MEDKIYETIKEDIARIELEIQDARKMINKLNLCNCVVVAKRYVEFIEVKRKYIESLKNFIKID